MTISQTELWRCNFDQNVLFFICIELRGLDLRTGFFTYRQIQAATDNFNLENKIGEGGFGSVYKVCSSMDFVFIFFSPQTLLRHVRCIHQVSQSLNS